MQKRLRTNNQIRIPEVSVIDETGKQLGIMPTAQALALAQERDLDLVEVGPTVRPPTTKIMDYGKFMYLQSKQDKLSASKHKELETKTVRVGFKTGDHDLRFKAQKASEFLEDGHIVKLELTLRGREKSMAHLGKEKLTAFLTRLTVPFVTQGEPKRSPYGWVLMTQKDKKAPNKPKTS